MTLQRMPNQREKGAVDRMSKFVTTFLLTISTKMTEVIHQPAHGKPYGEPTITVNGQKLQNNYMEGSGSATIK